MIDEELKADEPLAADLAAALPTKLTKQLPGFVAEGSGSGGGRSALACLLDMAPSHAKSYAVQGVWRRGLKSAVEVADRRGRHFQSLGLPQPSTGSIVLDAREVVFMVERDALEIVDEEGEPVVAVEDDKGLRRWAWEHMTDDTRESQLAYGFLKRLGYVLYPYELLRSRQQLRELASSRPTLRMRYLDPIVGFVRGIVTRVLHYARVVARTTANGYAPLSRVWRRWRCWQCWIWCPRTRPLLIAHHGLSMGEAVDDAMQQLSIVPHRTLDVTVPALVFDVWKPDGKCFSTRHPRAADIQLAVANVASDPLDVLWAAEGDAGNEQRVVAVNDGQISFIRTEAVRHNRK